MGSLAVALVIPCIWYGDKPLAREFASAELPGDLEKGLQVAEVFAHGSGVISLLVTLWWIDMTHRRMIGYAATLTGLSSLVANALKNIFTRVRPHSGIRSMPAKAGCRCSKARSGNLRFEVSPQAIRPRR